MTDPREPAAAKGQSASSVLIRLFSTLLKTDLALNARFFFRLLLESKWRPPALEYLIFPPAVFLKRFAADLFVFFFGI